MMNYDSVCYGNSCLSKIIIRLDFSTQYFKSRLDNLVMMKEAGVLSNEEFDIMKQKLIAEIMG